MRTWPSSERVSSARVSLSSSRGAARQSSAELEPDPRLGAGVEGLYLALGGSGHGFKLAPSIGEVAADAILGREPRIDVRALDPGRFERGELLRLAYRPSARA